jgi:hypothetical protein
MDNRTPKFTHKDYQWFVDNISDLFSSPTDINQFAKRLRTTNPKFKEDYFIEKMVKKWEQSYEIDAMAEEATMKQDYDDMCIYGSVKNGGISA